VNLYLQHFIPAIDMMIDDEILRTTFCGINIHVSAVCQCHHPVLTDDGATAFVWSEPQHWHLKFKYALSPNRNVYNDCNYLATFIRSLITNIQDVLQTSSNQNTINGINLA